MSSIFDLSGHVAVVTGGNRGIGLGIAQALVGQGAAVALVSRDETRTEQAVSRLREADGARVMAVHCDVTDEAEVKSAFVGIVDEWGRLDSCFANAGIGGHPQKVTDLSLAEWREVGAVNLDGVFLTLREASRHMVRLGNGGSLVATSSLTAVYGGARIAAYSASKAGLTGLVRSLALELARFGISVNAVVPGWIETDLTTEMLNSDAFKERVLPRVPAGRWGTPADIGATAVYLASGASCYHTGDLLTVDGAYSMF